MVERKKIAIKYTVSFSHATGVVIYLTNIVKTLNSLSDKDKPIVYILFNDNAPLDEIKSINYPYIIYYNVLNYVELNVVYRAINKISRFFFNKSLILNYAIHETVDVFYDIYFENIKIKAKKYICWIPDFQPRYYPDNFSIGEYRWHENSIKDIIKNKREIALSSKDAHNDFIKFYHSDFIKVNILRFISIIPSVNYIESIDLSSFELPNRYFIVSNQFWPHKNHIVVLRALKILIQKHVDIKILFTGVMTTHRGNEYTEHLKKYIFENNLSSNIIILGYIKREHQLAIIKKSISVIQPSLFEGWSTIVEDVKALNHRIILSNIKVHIEQNPKNSYYFDSHDSETLSQLMFNLISFEPEIQNSDYNQNIKKFGRDILNLFEQ